MYRFARLFVFFIGLLSLTLFLSGCEFSASTANIGDVIMAKDSAGENPTTVFEPSDTVFSLVTLNNAPDDTQLKAVWTAVDVGDAAPANQLIDEVELVAGSGVHEFSLTPDAAFPAGSYKVEIYLNGELDRTLQFTVSGEVTEAPAAEPTAEPAPAATSDGSVASLEDVRQATVRILAEGSFVSPEDFEQYGYAGQGSGFIIDPSGLAVTNNHVVTGAAFLQVFIEGEDQPRNARILGVSECSDLALIDIDGDGFPYLAWYDGNIDVGLDVYGAGFPLFGNEEYTLTRGIVSKARADGESNWASVDTVLEHDATINPGSSGGPLVDANGRLIGVNYAGNSETNQYFAIGRDEAQRIISELATNNYVQSLGINGEAFINEDGSLSGIWVSSVASGSPADAAGIRGGDVLTRLEGLELATDGTMSSYCDILRSHTLEDTLSVEVLRIASNEVLEGQINGRELEPTSVITETAGDEVVDGTSYTEYVTITDDTGTLSVDVPAEWADTSGSAWVSDDTEIGQAVAAATSLDGFYNTWTTPGVFFGASESLVAEMDEQSLLDSFDYSADCALDGRYDYADSLYTGYYDLWIDCGGQGSVVIVLSATPEDRAFITFVLVQAVTDADLEAMQQILDTFVVLR